MMDVACVKSTKPDVGKADWQQITASVPPTKHLQGLYKTGHFEVWVAACESGFDLNYFAGKSIHGATYGFN